MYNGSTRQLALQKNVICSKCEGRGGKKVCIAGRNFFSKLTISTIFRSSVAVVFH